MAPLQQDLGVFDHSESMPKLSIVNCQFGEAAKHQFIFPRDQGVPRFWGKCLEIF